MKFEYIKKIEGEIMSLGNMVKTGDIIDLPEHFAMKALKRPEDYRLVEENKPQVITDSRIKRKYTRKVKSGDESRSS